MENRIVTKIREFNRYYTTLIGLMNKHILESDYSLTEVRTMYEIYHNPNIRARQIRDLLQVNEGYLSRLLNKLVNQNIISKIKSRNDNRIYSLSLTKNGEDIFLQLNQRSSDSIFKLIQHLSEREQEELVQNISKLQTLLKKNEY